MRTLLLLRGAPGCGKSTWIREHGLEDYALSADKIRMMCAGPSLTINGTVAIDQTNDTVVWKMLFQLLETRMQNGEFTVIDATNSKASDINKYKELCDSYKYRIYCVDMTGLPIEVCKERNRSRPELQQVPDEVIDKIYARFETQKIPSGVTVIGPDELDRIWMKRIDLSEYKAVHHIGDIHGSYTALMEYFKDGLKDDECYIFLGDYLDRGIENADVLKFLMEIYEKPNVFLLEGNHERWLWVYGNGGTTKSKEFEFFTRSELDDAGIDKKAVRKFYRRIGQCAWYTYHGREVFVCHGGLSTMPLNPTLVSTHQMVKGVGNYKDHNTVARSFDKHAAANLIQIHAHRNVSSCPIKESEHCYNLEGHVEFGGFLRCLKLTPYGIEEFEIKNTVFRKEDIINYEPKSQDEKTKTSVGDMILKLRSNRYVQEKRFGDISSFNFTKSAFYDKVWDEQTMKARGLYIDIPRQKIVARAYDKFFNINERPETKLDMLQYKLTFPARAYRKENGFLGIVSYLPATDDFFITTKSTPDGDFAQWFRALFEEQIRPIDREYLKLFLREHDVSAVFECVDMVHDPHVIEYPDSRIYLLDLVENKIPFSKLSYDEVQNLASTLKIRAKKLEYGFADWQEFFDWYNTVTMDSNNDHIEGYVVEGANGYMVKVKLPYYNFWKHMRSVAHSVIKSGGIRKDHAASLTTPLANHFVAWAKTLHDSPDVDSLPKDICNLRKLFFQSDEGKPFADS